MADSSDILLNHPAWEKPRLFGRQHGLNVLAIEEKYPSGIYQVEEESNAADSSTDQGNTEEQTKPAKANNSKSGKTGK